MHEIAFVFPESVQEYRMEQIEQLKAMRDAAKARLEALPDFRLMTSLSALIDDLESAFGLNSPAAAGVDLVEPVQSAPAIVAVTAILPEMEMPGELAPSEAAIADAGEPEEMPIADPSLAVEVSPVAAPTVPASDIGAPATAGIEIVQSEVFVEDPEEKAADAAQIEELIPSAEALEVLEAVEEALSAEEFALQEADNAIEPANDDTTVFGENAGLSESEEEAVNRALAELSVDLDEDEALDPARIPSVLRR